MAATFTTLRFEQRVKTILAWLSALLEESLVPSSDDPKAVSSAFHSALMSGTRLCLLAQKLHPGFPVRYNTKPRSPASAIDNVNTFLRVFQRSAAVGRPFVPMDLYNGTNLTAVLEYLERVHAAFPSPTAGASSAPPAVPPLALSEQPQPSYAAMASKPPTPRTASQKSLPRTPSQKTMQRTPSQQALQRTPSQKALQRTPSQKALQRTPSGRLPRACRYFASPEGCRQAEQCAFLHESGAAPPPFSTPEVLVSPRGDSVKSPRLAMLGKSSHADRSVIETERLKLLEEQAARKRALEEEVARKKAMEEEVARKRADEEASARNRAAEEARKKAAEDAENARRKALAEEENARKKAAEDAENARKKALDDENARQKARDEENARKKALDDENARKKAAEDAEKAKQKARDEENARKKALDEENARKKAAEDAENARKKRLDDENARQKARDEENARKKALDEENARKKAAEDAENARKKALDEENARKLALEERAKREEVRRQRLAQEAEALLQRSPDPKLLAEPSSVVFSPVPIQLEVTAPPQRLSEDDRRQLIAQRAARAQLRASQLAEIQLIHRFNQSQDGLSSRLRALSSRLDEVAARLRAESQAKAFGDRVAALNRALGQISGERLAGMDAELARADELSKSQALCASLNAAARAISGAYLAGLQPLISFVATLSGYFVSLSWSTRAQAELCKSIAAEFQSLAASLSALRATTAALLEPLLGSVFAACRLLFFLTNLKFCDADTFPHLSPPNVFSQLAVQLQENLKKNAAFHQFDCRLLASLPGRASPVSSAEPLLVEYCRYLASLAPLPSPTAHFINPVLQQRLSVLSDVSGSASSATPAAPPAPQSSASDEKALASHFQINFGMLQVTSELSTAHGIREFEATLASEQLTVRVGTTDPGRAIILQQLSLLPSLFCGHLERFLGGSYPSVHSPLPFVATERLPTSTILDWCRSPAGLTDQRTGWEARWQLLVQLAGSLEYLHNRKISHGPILASHVRVRGMHSQPEVKLSGFCAFPLVREPGYPHPPESEWSMASDVYALGVILRTISAETPQTVLSVDAALHPDCPEEFSDMIGKCLEASPSARITSARIISFLKRKKFMVNQVQQERTLKERYQSQSAELTGQSDVLNQVIDHVMISLKKAETENSYRQQDLDAAQKQFDDSDRSASTANANFTELQSEVESLTANLEAISDEVRNYRSTSKRREATKAHDEALEELTRQREQLEEEARKIREEIRRLRDTGRPSTPILLPSSSFHSGHTRRSSADLRPLLLRNTSDLLSSPLSSSQNSSPYRPKRY